MRRIIETEIILHCKFKRVCSDFQEFQLAWCDIMFGKQFEYTGHIIENASNDDAGIINIEQKCLFSTLTCWLDVFIVVQLTSG